MIGWRKLRADLRAYRLQWALITSVLVLGTAGLVSALDAQAVLKREIAASFDGAAAPDVALWFDTVDDALLARLAAQPGVLAAEARRSVLARVQGADGRELPLRLTLLRDPLASPVARRHRHAEGGAKPPPGLWVEQSGQGLLGLQAGEALVLRTPEGGRIKLPLAGYLHDPGVAPSTQERLIYAWATADAAAGLASQTQADQVVLKLAQRGDDSQALAQGRQIGDTAGGQGQAPLRVELLSAGHPHALLMTAMLRVLGVLSALAFVSSAAWAGWMVALWMKRELRVVGILKTLGAGSRQIAQQYLMLALPVALLASACGLLLGAALGRGLVGLQAGALNIDVVSMAVPGSLRALELALALGLPLLSVALPILRAARLTPLQAIHDAGVLPPAGAGFWRTRLLRLPGHHRWTLALRNSFRRPWRLGLMLLALASGGALLLTTHSNHEGLMRTIDRSQAEQGHDIEVLLQNAAPAAALLAIAGPMPEVEVVEAWQRNGVVLAAAPEGTPTLALVGYPAASSLFRLPVLAGRAPADAATDEILANRSLLDAHPQIRLGQALVLRHHDRQTTVRVVGLVEEIGQPQLYAPLATFQSVTALGDAANALRIRVRGAPGQPLEPVARRLDQRLIEAHQVPRQIITREAVRDALDEHFKVVGDVIRMVALAAALVGGVWLAASSSLNVLERTREIGVLRALGATPRAIAMMFLAEGGAVLGIAVLIAVALSLLLTHLLNQAAATQLLHMAVPLHFSLHGLAVLAAGAGVVLLAVAAAVQRVMRLSASEALAYE